MLGLSICDPMGMEGQKKEVRGLGLLPVHTILDEEKHVGPVEGISLRDEIPFRGYEIHHGRTRLEQHALPLLRMKEGGMDGAISRDGHIAGCYVHQFFDQPAQREKWLELLHSSSDGIEQNQRVDEALDQIAEALERYLDLEAILQIAEENRQTQ